MSAASNSNHTCRKWIGFVLILIELFTASATVYGFSSFFTVLTEYGVYDEYCTSTIDIDSTATPILCADQTEQYQSAATLGIILFDVSAVFVGIFTDFFGCRFVKLIAIVLHVIGWLSLALIKPGRDYLLYVHTSCTSLSGTMIVITAYASCGYFSKGRACSSALYAGASIAAAVWYSIFKMFIDAGYMTLPQLCYIWMSIGFLMCITSFLNLDWRFPVLNLPYQFDTTLERSLSVSEVSQVTTAAETTKLEWYQNIYKRNGILEHLTSPLYLLIVLFLSILFTSIGLLSITWYPWVYHIVKHDVLLADKYTIIFNMLALISFVICPLNGFLLEFRADRSRKQQFLNISISQTVTWLLSIVSCTLCMFTTTNIILPVMIFNNIAHAMVEGGCQAALSVCFPSKYIGTLCGFMWTFTGLVSLIQYELVELTHDVPGSWRAWLILFISMILMSCHLVQIWSKYLRERKNCSQTCESQ